MKVRSDFVTNSSSSSFTLVIDVALKDNTGLLYEMLGCDECVSLYYEPEEAVDFDTMSAEEIKSYLPTEEMKEYGIGGDAYESVEVNVSPKELGQAGSIQELIDLLKSGVTGDWDGEQPVFKNPNDWAAAEFIRGLSQLNSMDEIKSITITGDEMNYMEYNRTYSYDLETGEYTKYIDGEWFEKDGGSGGDLNFSDAHEATLVDERMEY